jgi:hypothetical protein
MIYQRKVTILSTYLNPLEIVVKNKMKNANCLLLLTARIDSIIKALYDTNFSFVYYCY